MINDTIDDVERDGVGGEVGRGKREESGPVVIDLTLSSSDEEDEAPPRTRTVRLVSLYMYVCSVQCYVEILSYTLLFRGFNFRSLPVNHKNYIPRKFPAIYGIIIRSL